MHHRVEEIVVIPDDQIAPFAQIQPQLKGADPEAFCRVGQGLPGKTSVSIQQGGQRVFHPVIIALGIGAGFRQAGGVPLLVFAEAGFFFGRQSHAAECKPRRCGTQASHRIFGGSLRCVAGGEVEQLFSVSCTDGFQRRKNRAHGLADAGGCLTEQAGSALVFRVLSGGAGTVNFPRQCPLAGAVGRKRKWQRRQALVPPGVPVQLPPRPRRIAMQQIQEKGFQLRVRKHAGKPHDLVGIDLVIGQPDGQPLQPLLLAVDRRIKHPLRPVAGVPVLGDLLRREGSRFDLVEGHGAVLCRKNAVGTSFDGVGDAVHRPLRRKWNFGLIALACRLLEPAVDPRTLVGAVEPGKPAVDAAGTKQKFHQLADRQTELRHRFPLPDRFVYGVTATIPASSHIPAQPAPPVQSPQRRGNRFPVRRGSSWPAPSARPPVPKVQRRHAR